MAADPWRLILIGPAFDRRRGTAPGIGDRRGASIACSSRFAGHRGRRFRGAGPLLPFGVFLGNLWTENGLGGNALLAGVREPVIGSAAWAFSGQLASLAAILLAALVVSWLQRNFSGARSLTSATRQAIQITRSRRRPLLLFLIAYWALLAIYAMIGVNYDRYLFPIVPIAAILLVGGSRAPAAPGRSHAFAHAALAWLAVSAFVIAGNSMAYDAARWRLGDAAMLMGYEAATVDAGYEWVGYHASGVADADADYGVTWYDDRLMSARPCAVVGSFP